MSMVVAQAFRNEGSPKVGEGDAASPPTDELAHPPEVYDVLDFLHQVYAWCSDNLALLMAAATAVMVLLAIRFTLKGVNGHKLGES